MPKAGVMAHLCNVSSRGLAGSPQGLAHLASPAEMASCRFSERRVSKSKVEEGDVAQGLQALAVLVEFSSLLPSKEDKPAVSLQGGSLSDCVLH